MTELTEYLQQKSGRSSTDPDSLTLTSDDLEKLWSELTPDSYRARRGLELFRDIDPARLGELVDAQA